MILKTLNVIALILLNSHGFAQAQAIQIEHEYARASSPIAKSGSIFMHIMNNSPNNDRLITVRTETATTPEIHTLIMEDGIAKMRKLEDGVEIVANNFVILERGGMHIMMMGLTHPLHNGDVITITLIFEMFGEITIDVPVDNERQGTMKMDHSMSGDASDG